MCHARDFRHFEQAKRKAAEDEIARSRRAEVVEDLMSGAKKEAERAAAEPTQAKEPAPAK